MLLQVLLITAIAGIGGTGLGGALGAVIRRDSSKMVSLFLSFAAGVMLCVVSCDLIMEAIAPSGGEQMNVFLVIGGILVGFFVIFLLNLAIDRSTNKEVRHTEEEGHPSTADDLDELIHSDHLEHHMREPGKNSSYHLFIAGVIMASAIALHNLPEGMVIGASFTSGGAVGDSLQHGILMAVIIGLHNIPEGMAVSVPLISGEMKRWKSVAITAASGAPTVLGALIGYYVGTLGPIGLCLSLSFASGAMIYVVLGELLPEAILMWRSKAPAFGVLAGFLVGLIVIFT